MTATILRIPNEPHLARVREARRERGLWLAPGIVFGRLHPTTKTGERM